MGTRRLLPLLIILFLVSGVAASKHGETAPANQRPDDLTPPPGNDSNSVLPELGGDMLPSQAGQNAVNVLDTIGSSFSKEVDGLGDRLGSALSGLLGQDPRANETQ